MGKDKSHHRSELAAYLNHLRRKNYSARTLDVYGYALEQLLSFLAASGVERLQDTRREHLDGYRLHLVERKLTESSLEIFLRSARQFFTWLEDRQAIFDNPARGLIVPKSVRPLLPAPTEEEMTKLLAQPDVSAPTGIRDRALIETVYCCGLRREEAIRLTIFDPDLSGRTLRVLGKGAIRTRRRCSSTGRGGGCRTSRSCGSYTSTPSGPGWRSTLRRIPSVEVARPRCCAAARTCTTSKKSSGTRPCRPFSITPS
jgi:site-specific recombinase XerD